MLTLLPKNGRLLTNWRPITLLSYQFFKCQSLRLKRVLHDIIKTCGIHGRYIYDIALSRDIIDYAKCVGIPMSIINIDQEKAIDRVSHEYLFRVLTAFGLSDRFISFIKLCYIYMCPVLLILMEVCVGL